MWYSLYSIHGREKYFEFRVEEAIDERGRAFGKSVSGVSTTLPLPPSNSALQLRLAPFQLQPPRISIPYCVLLVHVEA